MKHIIEVLGASIEKQGEKPLTNKWLLDILKMAEKNKRNKQEKEDDCGYKRGYPSVFTDICNKFKNNSENLLTFLRLCRIV